MLIYRFTEFNFDQRKGKALSDFIRLHKSKT
jgi:hypothetical protein